MLRTGDTIEYLADVSSPPSQKGIRGQTKIIDRDIPMWTAQFLLRGGKVRPYNPASPLQLEEKKTKAGTKVKKERRTKTNGRAEKRPETNQAGDNGPEKPNPKRKAGSGGG